MIAVSLILFLKTRKNPILRFVHQTMLYRIDPTIPEMRSKIRLIPNVMLPKPTLPNPSLLPSGMTCAHVSQRNLA